MGFFDDVGKWLGGSGPEKYDPNSAGAQNAASMGTAYGSTDYLGNVLRGGLKQTAAGAQGADMGNYNADRGQQGGLVNMLTNAANGQGPSGAAMAGQAARDASLNNAAALQAGRRGVNAAQAATVGAGTAMQGVQNANQQEAMGRANEMATARGQMGGVLGQMAGQDIGVGQMQQQNQQFNAGQTNNMAQFNQMQEMQAAAGLQGQAGQEMQNRLAEQGYVVQTLNPGSPGLLSQGVQAFAGGMGKGMTSDPAAKRDVTSASPFSWVQPQNFDQAMQQRVGSLAPGHRMAPYFGPTGAAGAVANLAMVPIGVGATIAGNIAGKYTGKFADWLDQKLGFSKKPDADDQSAKDAKAFQAGDATLSQLFPHGTAAVDGPVTDPSQLGDGTGTSDPKAKRDVRSADGGDGDPGPLHPVEFEYNDRAQSFGEEPGRHVGVLATDLLKTPMGRDMVFRDPQSGYLKINYVKGLPGMLSGLADLNQRLAKLEKK